MLTGGFMGDRGLAGNQIEFLDMVIDHLTEAGIMDAERLCESPYTDMSPSGLEALFGVDAADELVFILNDIHARAAA